MACRLSRQIDKMPVPPWSTHRLIRGQSAGRPSRTRACQNRESPQKKTNKIPYEYSQKILFDRSASCGRGLEARGVYNLLIGKHSSPAASSVASAHCALPASSCTLSPNNQRPLPIYYCCTRQQVAHKPSSLCVRFFVIILKFERFF